MVAKPNTKPAGVVGGSRRVRRRVEGGPEGRVPGSPAGGLPAPKGPPPPTPVNLPAEGRVPGPPAGGLPARLNGPPPPTPVNLPAEGRVPGPAAGGFPAPKGPPPPQGSGVPFAADEPTFIKPPGPTLQEFLVARAVKEDLELDDETLFIVKFEPNDTAVHTNRIVFITVEGMTPAEMQRRELTRHQCAMCFDELAPPPIESMVETPPLQNTNSNTVGSEGRVPAAGEGGREGRVPAHGEFAGYRYGPDVDMVFASIDEEEPPVAEVSVTGGVGFRRPDPRSGFSGISDSDSNAIDAAEEGVDVSSHDSADRMDGLSIDA